jgi:hypothetical protein
MPGNPSRERAGGCAGIHLRPSLIAINISGPAPPICEREHRPFAASRGCVLFAAVMRLKMLTTEAAGKQVLAVRTAKIIRISVTSAGARAAFLPSISQCFDFAYLPASYFAFLLAVVVAFLLMTDLVKRVFYACGVYAGRRIDRHVSAQIDARSTCRRSLPGQERPPLAATARSRIGPIQIDKIVLVTAWPHLHLDSRLAAHSRCQSIGGQR